jgi:hypothetical protein
MFSGRLGVAGYFAAQFVAAAVPSGRNYSFDPAARDGGSYNNEAFIRLGVSCIIPGS